MKPKIKLALRLLISPGYTKHFVKTQVTRWRVNKERAEAYDRWFEQQVLNAKSLAEQRKEAASLSEHPLISILLPTYNTKPEFLKKCIDSILAQTYSNWELCISDDASTNEETKQVLRQYQMAHDRIRVIFNESNGHIAACSNIALKMAKGEFVSLVDHDDELPPNALFETVKAINNYPDVDLIYTDEDKIDQHGRHIEPFFKPDWSPSFLDSCNVITHFATIRTKVMRNMNGFKIGTHGAQDWDLFLRIAKQTQKIHHIPMVLYHWRKSETSTAMNAKTKPYAYISQRRALRDSIVDREENAYVEAHSALGFWRKKYVIGGTPLVSIVIPTRDSYEYISRCVDSILEKTTYPYFEIVIVDTGSTEAEVKAYYKKLSRDWSGVRVTSFVEERFNFSKACNYGAMESKGEYLLFLNNDTEVITPSWVQSMLEHAQRKNIGMVGAKLLFPNDTIQHAGIVLSEQSIAFHPFYGKNPVLDIFTYIYADNIREVSAVTAACSMVSRRKFDEVGGFDPALRVTYNDVDLNLKLREAGYTNLYTPYAMLYHFESISVGKINTGARNQKEVEESSRMMRQRWGTYLSRDPYYNDNFEQFGPGYRLKMPNS